VTTRPPIVAVIGRRMGRTAKWPYSGATAIPGAYLDAVTRAGARPVVVDPVGDLVPLLDRVDALLLTGGPDIDPGYYGEPRHAAVYGTDGEVDAGELALARAAIERETPTLAICRGLQVLNVALGGTLHQHIPERAGIGNHGRPGENDGAHLNEIHVDPDSLLHQVFGTNRVAGSCHHHQAVDKVADGLRIVATTDDGTVEGLEVDGAWLLAVQWHPEDTAPSDTTQQALFDALIARTHHSSSRRE